jgi:hypothetical protein
MRLQNQRLAATEFSEPVEVVRWLGAVQSQDYPAAKWALGQRLKHGTEALIDRAFDEGAILRTHVMRPTWHFVAPEDIRWLLKLTGPRIRKASAHAFRGFGLDLAVLKKSEKILSRILKNNTFLTRAEIRAALAKSGLEPGEPTRLAYILISAEINGLICSGGRKGKQFTYALLDERAPSVRELTREDSIAELTRRYFRSHGPATLADYVWWSGMTRTDANAGIEMLGNELSSAEDDEKQFWFVSERSSDAQNVQLLPPFDEFWVGYLDRSHSISAASVELSRNPLFGSSVLINGKLVGTWTREFSKGSGAVVVKPFTKLRRVDWVAIKDEVVKYSEFIGVAYELRRG